MSQFSSSAQEDENSCCESDEEFNLHKKPQIRVKSGVSEAVQGQTQHDEHCTRESEVLGQTPMQAYAEDRMRRKLQFFFMNPIEKWQARRRFPYKFAVQLVKIVLVTIQLCLFAHSRYNHVNYTWDNRVTFSHLFLKGWDSNMEILSYPPSTEPLAIYKKEDFYLTVDAAYKAYSNLSQAIGPYSYTTENNTILPPRLCLHSYKEGSIFGFNESYVFNPEIVVTCLNLAGNCSEMGSKVFLHEKEIQINFSALVEATLEFAIKTVNFKAAGPIASPDCYQFNIVILFDNRDHDGKMLLTLDAEPIRLHCMGNAEYMTDSEIEFVLRSILNMFVIIVCLISFVLCTRAVYRAQLLRNQTTLFFRSQLDRELSWDGKMEFLNIWYIMIICNDVLLIVGSALKEQIERTHFLANEWNMCSLLLGIGNLLVWFGLLRYLGFFKTYNVVILTIKRAAPKISRFLLCALLIYAGFTFCGWLVLGPYHLKFRSLATTAECLFSLINGDDMFATFATMSSKSTMLWWFSRIYLYSFISLYIYVVLSLFISVIMDAYDTIKHYYKEGFPTTDLKQFMGTMHPGDLTSGAFTEEDNGVNFTEVVQRCFCWLREKTTQESPARYSTITPNNS